MHKLLPERDDVLREGRAPRHIRKFLMNVGGVNPWGENRYRLVRAECVMEYVGARWHDWDKGVEFLDQGGLQFSERKRKSTYLMRDPTNPSREVEIETDVPATVSIRETKPVRTVEEMRWIPRYSDLKGWLFQVWYPSSFYSPEHYRITVKGRPDLPLLGEFPSHGRYERQFITHVKDKGFVEALDSMPGESWMERAIQHHEAKLAANNSPNVEYRMLITMAEIQKARENYDRKVREEFELKCRERIQPLFSNSLEGGRIREQLARRCLEKGIKLGHVGN